MTVHDSHHPLDGGPFNLNPPRRVCVFCGASDGAGFAYRSAAASLGAALAKANIGLVYGGGADGLMGCVARAALDEGGEVIGIIPRFLLHRTLRLEGPHRLMVVDSMHARKTAMADAAEAFVALPGGIGTVEELVEQLTWLKLAQHAKPVIIANIVGFWEPLLKLFAHMKSEQFMHAGRQHGLTVCETIDGVLATLGIAVDRRDGPASASGILRVGTDH